MVVVGKGCVPFQIGWVQHCWLGGVAVVIAIVRINDGGR